MYCWSENSIHSKIWIMNPYFTLGGLHKKRNWGWKRKEVFSLEIEYTVLWPSLSSVPLITSNSFVDFFGPFTAAAKPGKRFPFSSFPCLSSLSAFFSLTNAIVPLKINVVCLHFTTQIPLNTGFFMSVLLLLKNALFFYILKKLIRREEEKETRRENCRN